MRRVTSLDVHVVHLVRDGRAVAHSSMRNLGWSPETAASWWVDDNRRSERARRYFAADRWLRVRYEDLCADVAGTVGRIHAFLGVPAADPAGAADGAHHVIGNRMRLRSLEAVRLVERWRTARTPEQRRAIDPRVARWNRRYGYTTEGPSPSGGEEPCAAG
jgi:hypothetical protein